MINRGQGITSGEREDEEGKAKAKGEWLRDEYRVKSIEE